MRSVNFRDGVLHAVAYKLGLDPEQSNFLENQAIPIGTFIDEWVRRVYDARDFPEWTYLHQFAPVSHIVTWDALASDLAQIQQIGRSLKVFLVDPKTTDAPVDTPFTLRDNGLHVGYEHGSSVWVEYMRPAPKFTAIPWAADKTYQKGDVVYSITTGECYVSKSNGNLGNDPAHAVNYPLQSEIVSQRVPSGPGLGSIPKIVDVDYSTLTPDPAGTINYFSIFSDTPPNIQVDAIVYNGAANETATQIRDGVLAALIADVTLASYTFTAQSSPLRIRVEKLEDFSVYPQPYSRSTGTGVETFLTITQVQAYTPAVLSTNTGARQFTSVAIGAGQVKSSSTYALTFTDDIGVEHEVTYLSGSTDTELQIISGLINAIQSAKATDAFFNDVFASIGASLETLSISTSQEVSVTATRRPPPSQWWEEILFPRAIADQVIRGAYGDLLKEWSQTDKGSAEEQAVPSELAITESKFTTTPDPALTGQQQGMSRYKI